MPRAKVKDRSMNSEIRNFSVREKEVARLLMEGKGNKQIALTLGITESTVEYHLKNIYKKLQVSSRTEAVLRLGKSTGGDTLRESTVEIKGETAENGGNSISAWRLLMNKKIFVIGGGLLVVALLAMTFLTNLPDQNENVPPASVTPVNTSAPDVPSPTEIPYTLVEVEQVAGFDVQEPAYLPNGVSFDHAVYQKSPRPRVTLYYKLIHETYGDMGTFFHIVQEPQASGSQDPAACGTTGSECEIIPVGEVTVYYRLTSPTEFLFWDLNGYSFSLLRTAGEPEKNYKEELLKVVEGMMPLTADRAVVSQARDTALSVLADSFSYVEPLEVITEGEMSYADLGRLMKEPVLDHPAELRVWVSVYFNEAWQYKPLPETMTPFPPFRGCVVVTINLTDGSPMGASGPLSKDILLECDN